MTEAPPISSPHAAIAIDDLSAIGAVLAEMWRAAEENVHDAGGEGKPLVRVCLGSVVVVTDRERASRIEETLDRLAARRPSRALVARIDGAETGGGIRASIRAVCNLPTAGAPQVCCEQIQVSLGPEGVARLPGIVVPLLVADAPSILWWDRDVREGDEVFRRLAKEVGAVLIDLERIEDCAVARGLRASLGGAKLHDLAWARIEPWRRAIACAFDDRAMRPCLRAIRSAEIVADPADGVAPKLPAKGLLALGWLAAQLGWKASEPLRRDGERWVGAAQGPNGRVELSLARGECAGGGGRSGHLASVRLRADGDREVFLERRAEGGMIRVAVQARESCPLRRGASEAAPSADALIGAALEAASREDPVYANALQKALELAG